MEKYLLEYINMTLTTTAYVTIYNKHTKSVFFRIIKYTLCNNVDNYLPNVFLDRVFIFMHIFPR